MVVGAGFAGLRALRALGGAGVLVDSKGFFEYTPAAPRSLVCAASAERALRPLPAGAVQGRAVGLETLEGGGAGGSPPAPPRLAVVLEDGRRLPCQCVVWASGALYPCEALKPAPLARGGAAARRAALEGAREELRRAHRVAVLGGGQAGVEVAAEVAGEFRGGKRVLLVCSTERLLPGMPPRAGAFARQWLEGRGVEIWLGTRAEVADRPAAPSGRRQRRECLTLVSSGGGLRFEADLLYDCTGNHFSSESLPRQLSPDLAGGAALEAGQIRVDAALQVEGLEGVFACGDICQPRAWQTAFQAELTGEAAGRNALRALSGRPPRAFPAAASPTVVAVSLHRRSGILQFNRLILTGLLAAGMKALVEACVLGSVSGSRLAGWAMVLMERIAFLLGRVVPPPRKES